MNKSELKSATEIARSERDLSSIDDSLLFGCGLPGFAPVNTTLDAVAKLFRYQCATLSGGWDMEEFDHMCRIAKKRFIIAG